MQTKIHKAIPSVLVALFLLVPAFVFAHQPRIVETRLTTVSEPEVSKAYYAKLTGEPDVYVIESSKPFDLYVGVLVPDIAGQKKDVSAAIIKNGDTANPLGTLDGIGFEWKSFFEEFGHDTYWQGPEYKARVEEGTYEIRVWSSNNDSKYSLAVGEIEAFDFKEGLNALTLVPQLKKNFFSESPINFILSPMGYGLIIIMYLLAGMVGLVYRFILKRVAKNTVRGVSKNIGTTDRVIRIAIGVVLLLLAITTTWNPILIFFSGFAFFEALFSWCGFYAALGKNTCPVV